MNFDVAFRIFKSLETIMKKPSTPVDLNKWYQERTASFLNLWMLLCKFDLTINPISDAKRIQPSHSKLSSQQMRRRKESVSTPLNSRLKRDQQFIYTQCCKYAVEAMPTSKSMFNYFFRSIVAFIPKALIKKQSTKAFLWSVFHWYVLSSDLVRRNFFQIYVHKYG